MESRHFNTAKKSRRHTLQHVKHFPILINGENPFANIDLNSLSIKEMEEIVSSRLKFTDHAIVEYILDCYHQKGFVGIARTEEDIDFQYRKVKSELLENIEFISHIERYEIYHNNKLVAIRQTESCIKWDLFQPKIVHDFAQKDTENIENKTIESKKDIIYLMDESQIEKFKNDTVQITVTDEPAEKIHAHLNELTNKRLASTNGMNNDADRGCFQMLEFDVENLTDKFDIDLAKGIIRLVNRIQNVVRFDQNKFDEQMIVNLWSLLRNQNDKNVLYKTFINNLTNSSLNQIFNLAIKFELHNDYNPREEKQKVERFSGSAKTAIETIKDYFEKSTTTRGEKIALINYMISVRNFLTVKEPTQDLYDSIKKDFNPLKTIIKDSRKTNIAAGIIFGACGALLIGAVVASSVLTFGAATPFWVFAVTVTAVSLGGVAGLASVGGSMKFFSRSCTNNKEIKSFNAVKTETKNSIVINI